MATAQPPLEAPASAPAPSGGFSFGSFFSFRYMITPVLVQGIYIIGAVLITIFGLVAMFGSTPSSSGPLGGLLIIVFGNLLWRVYMEIVMLFFRINDGIQRVERNTRR